MKFKYCLIRQADYTRNGRCVLPVYAENIYFYTLNDLKAYIAEELYQHYAKIREKGNRNVLYTLLREFAKYVVLNPNYIKPSNKISYYRLYEDTYTYIMNEGVQKDESYITGKIKAREMYWYPYTLCEPDWNDIEKELIPFVERVIYALIGDAYDRKLIPNFIYYPTKIRVECKPVWDRPKTYTSHQYRKYRETKHQYIREKAKLQDTEVNATSRQRLRSKEYFSGRSKYSLGWKDQNKCRKAWMKHKTNAQYETPTKAVYEMYMQEWFDNSDIEVGET